MRMMAGEPPTRISDAIPPWLDAESRALLEDMVVTQSRASVLAAIRYGSMARRDERPLDDAQPSDVDVLVVFNTDDERIALHEGAELFRILGRAYDRHVEAPRDVKVMFASRTLGEWDSTFVTAIARDGVLLWARGPLPVPLAAVA
jgi:predicted nucleotidyltransferase